MVPEACVSQLKRGITPVVIEARKALCPAHSSFWTNVDDGAKFAFSFDPHAYSLLLPPFQISHYSVVKQRGCSSPIGGSCARDGDGAGVQ